MVRVIPPTEEKTYVPLREQPFFVNRAISLLVKELGQDILNVPVTR